MNTIEIIHEHSVDTSLLLEGAKILDIGCRGFGFVDHFKSLGHTVHAVDIDNFDRPDYDRIAISDVNMRVGIVRPNDPQATHIRPGDDIEAVTLAEYSKRRGIDFWDLIKMDIEGSELAVILSLEKAPAKQLSIEFHLHTGIYGQDSMTMMEDKLKALGYEAVSHVYDAQHCAGFNFWNSLFILK